MSSYLAKGKQHCLVAHLHLAQPSIRAPWLRQQERQYLLLQSTSSLFQLFLLFVVPRVLNYEQQCDRKGQSIAIVSKKGHQVFNW
jgi:hypothetical protein